MKIYIHPDNIAHYDYVYTGELYGYGIVVPDNFNAIAMSQEWHKECFVPKTGKNKYGPYVSKTTGKYSKSFEEYLNDKYGYELLEIIS